MGYPIRYIYIDTTLVAHIRNFEKRDWRFISRIRITWAHCCARRAAPRPCATTDRARRAGMLGEHSSLRKTGSRRRSVARHSDQDRNIRVEGHGNKINKPLAFGLRTAEPVDDNEIGTIFDRRCESDRETGEPVRVEPASMRGRSAVRCKPDDFAFRKYDDTQLRIFRVTGPATLDDPNRSVAGTVEIGGEAGDQRVRVFASTVNQGRQIGLGVEGQAASLSIYSCVYTELLDVGKPQVHLRRDRPNRARQHFA